jgi:hypothetical protein
MNRGAGSVRRAWRVGLVAVATVVVAGVGTAMVHVNGAVPDNPCPQLSRAEIEPSGIRFVNSFASSQNRVNDILIRAENGAELDCVQVLDRARCSTGGPKTVRVMAGRLVEHFEIAAGQRATLRAAPDGIACGVEAV